MDIAAFTRQLVDIESITGNEGRVGDFLHRELLRRGFQAEKIPVEGTRCNVFPESPRPAAARGCVLHSHGSVSPFIPSSEDAYAGVRTIGSCDAKGIIATQVVAAERLRQDVAQRSAHQPGARGPGGGGDRERRRGAPEPLEAAGEGGCGHGRAETVC